MIKPMKSKPIANAMFCEKSKHNIKFSKYAKIKNNDSFRNFPTANMPYRNNIFKTLF